MTPVFDPFHSPWRELDGVMNECGLKSSMLLSSVSHNLEFGPWDGQAFHQALVDAAKELENLCDANDPILSYVWPRICKDRGIDEDDAEAKDAFITSLSAAEWLQAKGPRVCTSRWGTWCAGDCNHPLTPLSRLPLTTPSHPGSGQSAIRQLVVRL